MTLTTRLPRVTKASEGNQYLRRHALIWKGPISYWLAKVDNAASAGTTGLQWFKVAHDGLANGKWAVDTMIANGGWHYFTMPTCIAPGDYLMRVELLALHSASSQGM
jgi:cellulase